MKIFFLLFLAAIPLSGQAGFDGSLEVAKTYLDASIQSDFVKKDPTLLREFSKMRNVLMTSHISLKEKRCVGRFQNYVAYVDGTQKKLNVYFCRGYSFLPKESLAQTIIHELSHILFSTDEQEATRLESISTYLGGRTPELNGYNSDEFFEAVVSAPEEDLRNRSLDYFVLMNVRTAESFLYLKLKTYAIYKHKEGMAYVLSRLCGNDRACMKEMIHKKDEFGISPIENLISSGVSDTGSYFTF